MMPDVVLGTYWVICPWITPPTFYTRDSVTLPKRPQIMNAKSPWLMLAYFLVTDTYTCVIAVFLFGLIWGRNRAPFPMPKSIFYSQLLINNSQSKNCATFTHENQFILLNHSFLVFAEAKLPKVIQSCDVLGHGLRTFKALNSFQLFPISIFRAPIFPIQRAPPPFPKYWKGTLHRQIW